MLKKGLLIDRVNIQDSTVTERWEIKFCKCFALAVIILHNIFNDLINFFIYNLNIYNNCRALKLQEDMKNDF